MTCPEGNTEWILFPENLNVSPDEVEGNVEIRGKQGILSYDPYSPERNFLDAGNLSRVQKIFAGPKHSTKYIFRIISSLKISSAVPELSFLPAP